MEQNQTPAAEPAESPENVAAMFDGLMRGEGNQPFDPSGENAAPPPKPARRGDDSPAEPESQGPSASDDGSSADPPDGDEREESVLAKLERLKREKHVVDERIHQERERNAQLEARLAALEGRQQQPQNQQTPAEPFKLSDSEIEQIGSTFDKEWSENKNDPDRRYAVEVAANMMADIFRGFGQQMQDLTSQVSDYGFNQRLSDLEISRSDFDHIWSKPGYEWGANLSQEQKLAALESMAQRPGSRPSQPAPSPGQGGAPTASRVNPRSFVETNQSPGSAQDPRRLSTRAVDEAFANEDYQAASQNARSLFAKFTGIQG